MSIWLSFHGKEMNLYSGFSTDTCAIWVCKLSQNRLKQIEKERKKSVEGDQVVKWGNVAEKFWNDVRENKLCPAIVQVCKLFTHSVHAACTPMTFSYLCLLFTPCSLPQMQWKKAACHGEKRTFRTTALQKAVWKTMPEEERTAVDPTNAAAWTVTMYIDHDCTADDQRFPARPRKRAAEQGRIVVAGTGETRDAAAVGGNVRRTTIPIQKLAQHALVTFQHNPQVTLDQLRDALRIVAGDLPLPTLNAVQSCLRGELRTHFFRASSA